MLRLTKSLPSLVNSKAFVRRTYADLSKLSPLVDIDPRVHEALRGSPGSVVALESTIITHGMPYPHNLETALEVEQIVRQKGAIPATIAIVDGRIKVGTTADQLARLAQSDTIKTSRRDLAYVLSKGLSGGTTVAGTLLVADMVGIRVFATGGIGGVHRGGEDSLDVSADLVELGRTPVAVVSSGVKSILDIPRTLEYLETQGVCVASYGSPERDFPAFYTRRSGSKAVYNFDSAGEAANAISVNGALGLRSGFLIGVPIPAEHALDQALMDGAIAEALAEATRQNIGGKEVTPFILAAVSKITQGKSLQSNMALIKNNASVAAEIAVELSRIESGQVKSVSERSTASSGISSSSQRVPVVIGGSIVDTCISVLDDDLKYYKRGFHRHLASVSISSVKMKCAILVPLICIAMVQGRTNQEYDNDPEGTDSTTPPTEATDSTIAESIDCLFDDSIEEVEHNLSDELKRDTTTDEVWQEITDSTNNLPNLDKISQGSAEEFPPFKPLGKPKGLLDFAGVAEYKLEWRKVQDE